MTLSYMAKAEDEGRKIYGILKHELNMSAALVRRLKNAKGIYLNGVPAYTTVTVKEGDVISADPLLAEKETDIEPEDGELSILFENDGFIVLNKPCGMIVHPSRAKFHGSLAGICAGYFRSSGQNVACHVVNRLDRDTSGIVVIAKSAHYKTLLNEALHAEEAEKKYIAVLYGTLTPNVGTVDAPIRRAEEQKMRRIVAPDGQRAVTDYRITKTAQIDGQTVSSAEFILKTGRTHQIRVHSSYMGAPLLGDALYGNEASKNLSAVLGIETQMLHAVSLKFRDPVSGELLVIDAPVKRESMNDIMNGYFK